MVSRNGSPAVQHSSSSSVQFGTSVNLTCLFTATRALYSVEWFVNGYLRQTTTLSGNETQDVFVVDSFSEDGVYQCRVFSGNGDNSVEDVFISGRAGTPGLVRFPISLADTQTQGGMKQPVNEYIKAYVYFFTHDGCLPALKFHV